MKAFRLAYLALVVVVGCSRTERIPSREAVVDVLAALEAVDRPLTLALIAGTPPRPIPGVSLPPTQSSLQKDLELVQQGQGRAERELAFVESLNRPAKTLEDAKAKTKAFLDAPSPGNAKALRQVLNQLVSELEEATSSEPWGELVPSAASQPVRDVVSTLRTTVQAL